MSEIIKIGNAEIEKSNYNYFSTIYSKMPKKYVIADLVSKCEEYNRLYKSYEELEVKEMQKEDLLTELEEWLKETIKQLEINIQFEREQAFFIQYHIYYHCIDKIQELKEKYK